MDEEKVTQQFDTLNVEGTEYTTLLTAKYKNRKKYELRDPRKVEAFIPGTIIKVFVRKGKKVEAGDQLLILEAMKMQNIITAHVDGKIKAIHVKKGQMVPKGKVMVEME